jgi:hypothetical protein
MAAEQSGSDPGLRLSTTVRGVIDGAGQDPVAVHRLIDDVLQAHHKDYLLDWPWQVPTWPVASVEQPADRWLDELRPLVRGPLLFGRLAIVGWCLLEAGVAATATAAGMLGGVVAELNPTVEHHLTDSGLELLRLRAPLVALAAGQLPAALDLGVPPGSDIRHLAVADAGTAPRRSQRPVPWWATATRDQVVVGRGDSDGRPVLPDTETREVTGLGWSHQGRLVLALATAPGRLVHDPRTGRTGSEQDWPGLSRAAVSPRAVVGSSDDGGLVWGLAEAVGGPVPLRHVPVDPLDLVAVSPTGVAALGRQGSLVLMPPQEDRIEAFDAQEAHVQPAPAEASALGVVGGRAVVLTTGGSVHRIGTDGAVDESRPLPDGDARFLAAGDELVVVASPDVVAVVRDKALLARWHRPSDSGPITAVAVARDGSSLAVATEDRLRMWRIDAVPDLRLTEYTADTPDGEDRLGIRPTVDALAALVAARAVEPPLSIGLFGAWGSGKTFFMRRLEERVAAISRESRDSRRAQSDLWAWRNIRQVRFNAWTYAAADVWAGLVDELLRGLTSPPPEALALRLPDELEHIADRRLQRLADAQQAAAKAGTDLAVAESQRDHAKAELTTAEQNLEQVREEERTVRGRSTLDVLGTEVVEKVDSALEANGQPSVGADLDRMWRDLAEARRSAESVRSYLRGGGPAWLVVALAAGPALAVLVTLAGLDGLLDGVARALAGVTAGFVAVAAWLRSATGAVERRVAQVVDAEQQARAAVRTAEEQTAQKAEAVRSAEEALVRAEREAERKAAALERAESRAAETDPGSLLTEFLDDRVRSTDYRGALGLIGTVRGDIEAVSKAVQQHNATAAGSRDHVPDDVLNRVVLYVDDLDRCPPPIVVKVLEAIAMLLSFPLFVVVVAVDAAWVSRALATVYPTLLRGGRVTPEQYLEKIFQVPVWLDPPDAAGAGALAQALVGEVPRTAELAPGGARPREPGSEQAAPSVSRGAAQPPGSAAQQGGRPGGTPGRSLVVRDFSTATSAPQSLVLRDDERGDIARLAPLVARSPRALKRYVNTYRLLKGLLDEESLPVARLLLAAVTGLPGRGELLLRHVLEAPDDRTLGDVVDPGDRERLDAVAGAGLGWTQLRCGDVRPVAREVHRFVFRTGPGPVGRSAAGTRG